MSLQFIHCSDLHLDKSFNYLNAQNSIQRKEDVHQNFSHIVEFALKEKPDLFLVAGDTFDRVSPSNQSRVFLIREVRKLSEAGIHVFIIGGNHDVPRTPGISTMAIDTLSSAGLATVFSTAEVETQVVNIDGREAQVSGRSYLTQSEQQNPLRGVVLKGQADYSIYMVHGSLLGLDVRPSSPEVMTHNPFYADDVPKGVDYLAAGHYHNFYERDYRGCKIVNPGSIERLNWNELSEKKCFAWVEMNGSEVRVESIPLTMRPMESQSLVLNDAVDLTKVVTDYLTEYRDLGKIFRLGLVGKLSRAVYSKLDLGKVFEFGRNSFFEFDLDRQELMVEGERVFLGKVDNPIEAYRKRLDVLNARAESEDERQLLAEVKEVGVKLLEEARE